MRDQVTPFLTTRLAAPPTPTEPRPRMAATAPGVPPRRRAPVGRLVLLVLVLVGGMTLLSHPGRVALKMLVLLPEVLPDAPVRPLLWMSEPPRSEEYHYESAAGPVDADVYLPARGSGHGAVILYTGAFGLRRDPAFVQFAEALAREGAVVMAPESVALRNGDVVPAEADDLLQAVAYLRNRSEVDPARIGIFGFSAGGAIVLLAAEDPAGQSSIAFLNIFGSYFNARDLLREVVTHTMVVDGTRVAWEPADVTVYAVEKQVVSSLADPTDRAVLGRIYLDNDPTARGELARLSPEGRLVVELFDHPSPERADAILAVLPTASLERLAGVSPDRQIDRLQARLYVMHDRSDSFVPFIHSRQLAAEAPAGSVRHYAEFDLFGHVMPNRHLAPPAFVAEIFKLSVHGWLLGQEFL